MTVEQIQAELETLDKRVALGTEATISEFKNIFLLYDEIIRDNFTSFNQQAHTIAKVLFHIMECLNQDAIETIKRDDELVQKIERIIENLDGAFTEKSSGDALLVQFLHRLHKHESFYSQTDILDNCQMYVKRLDQIAWLFQLSVKGKKSYPISELLNISILDNFEPDQSHLKYLIASLQLFTENITIPEEAKSRIQRYSSLYNLKILTLLCSYGKVLFDSCKHKNMEKNGVIVVRQGRTVLVRTTNLSRSPRTDVTYEYETNSKGENIAQFFTYTLDAQENLCSLDVFFSKAPMNEKIQVIKTAITENTYNIFMQDSIRYNTGSMKFIGWTNPTASQDICIITPDKACAHTEKQFFDLLANPTGKCIRAELLAKQSLDILTVDFLAAFCVKVSIPAGIAASSFIPRAVEQWKCNLDREEYTTCQNKIICEFFSEVKKCGLDLLPVLSSYYQFISDNLKFTSDINYETRLVMPYCFYIPFSTNKEIFDVLLPKIGVELPETSESPIHEIYCDADDIWRLDTISDEEEFEVIDISTGESVEAFGAGLKYKAIYDKTRRIAYVAVDPQIKAIFNTIEKIKHENKKLCINDRNIKDFTVFNFEDLENIVYNIGISKTVLENFWPCLKEEDISKDMMEPLLLYKILCHLTYFKICGAMLTDWQELIFSCHLSKICDKYHGVNSEFREKLQAITPKSGAVMISKQSHADKSTVENIVSEARGRSMVDIAFDAQALQNHIKEQNNQYYFVEKGCTNSNGFHKIERIIFLTDNIISGTSTVKMILFHLLGKEPDENSIKRSYVTLQDHKLISKIISANKPIIQIYTAFWFSQLGEYVQTRAYDIPTFEIPVNNGEKIQVQVNACKTFNAGDYLYTDRAYELVKRIYGKKYRKDYEAGGKKCKKENDSRHLVFRYGNMPSFAVFPDDVLDTKKIIGLFDHRMENC